ncbi:MAG: leucyl aminopeptidase [Porticoccaceae bacterium]|jgi:leucyl aminopeptidase|nr:leucyl aminopeptidase [Porticoccaceae bacterium]MBT5578078.1 leucyl aminopeptidase [Porticoccaceae bacterium]MBT7375194.1 leucyl aminopeptidase [Porticoccaceae bacterium]
MDFTASSATLLNIKADSLILATGSQLENSAADLDKSLDGAISSLVKAGDFSGQAGESLVIHIPGSTGKRIILIGSEGANTVQRQIKVIEAGAAALLKTASSKAVWVGEGLTEDAEWEASMVARSVQAASYKYQAVPETSAKKPKPAKLKSVVYWTPKKSALTAAKNGLIYGASVGNGMNVARQLGNLPANICTPSYLASQAKALAKGQAKVTTSVLSEAEMKKLKMGSLLSVSAGSDQPAKLIVIKYQGTKASVKPTVLVGKAVTFDTGGISLKPGGGMDEMKYDMCGGASVIGVMNALIENQLPVNVVGIIPATENMPNGHATKPGDVVTSMSGQTIEILNTDAEGRLILCDALTYAARFKPDTVIDIATLTGAVIGALGKVTAGLLSNDDELADALLASGTKSGDRVWRMPLWEEYDELLKSNFADMANIGGPQAGTITAACFLARFAKTYKWAHLDVAGTAWVSGAQKGATGRPVPILMEYIRSKAN